jgi:hypothetical protein
MLLVRDEIADNNPSFPSSSGKFNGKQSILDLAFQSFDSAV